MKLNLFLSFLLISLSIACNETPEDKTQTINKDGAIESEISVTHLDSTHDILTTKHIVWVGGNSTKNILHSDTVASLGLKKEEAVNEQDETMNVTIPKEYEIYITIK
jgi:hypothetical protein